ncbi:MAG: hypothetical protein M1371_09650 [Actinobacteria bacterium]|nr:hypothetical protein [Actinomycetota bacterium]
MSIKNQKLISLLGEAARMLESAENRHRLSLWKRQPTWEIVIPMKWIYMPLSFKELGDSVPIVASGIQLPPACRLAGRTVTDFYENPEAFLEIVLNREIYRLKNLNDDVPFRSTIPLHISVSWECAILGMKHVVPPDLEPWIETDPLIKDWNDLSIFDSLNFRTSGDMPRIVKFYEYAVELVDGTPFTIGFPEFLQGPLTLLFHLRGFSEVLLDTIDNPDFLHAMLKKVTDFRIWWEKERAKYLNIPLQKALIRDDEISPPNMSARAYEQFAYPYEKQICDTHGGTISYWHSCGDNTTVFPILKNIGRIDTLHLSEWTNMEEALKIFYGTDTSFEIMVEQIREVQDKDGEYGAVRTKEIAAFCNKYNISSWYIDLGSIRGTRSIEAEIAKVNSWIKSARSALRK